MNTLRTYLDTHNVTIFDFAASVGLTRQAVHKWLRGDSMPTPVNLYTVHKKHPELDVVTMVCEIAKNIIQT